MPNRTHTKSRLPWLLLRHRRPILHIHPERRNQKTLPNERRWRMCLQAHRKKSTCSNARLTGSPIFRPVSFFCATAAADEAPDGLSRCSRRKADCRALQPQNERLANCTRHEMLQAVCISLEAKKRPKKQFHARKVGPKKMKNVLEIKRKYDLDAMIRVLSPSFERNVQRRREAESRKRRVNSRLALRGSSLRLL